MNENLDFQLWLRSKFDGDALKAAEAEFNRTKKAADGLGTSADELGYSMKSLKTALMEVFAVAEVWAQFKEGFEQVSKLEQVMNELERQTRQNGDSFDTVKGKIVGFADQLKKVAGLDDDAVIAGMTKLYTATKNVDEAMKLARLSADIAIATGKEYGEAQALVMSAAQGNVRALKELGLSFETTGDKSKDADIALTKLQKTFGGAAEGAKGVKVELNRMNEQWEDVRNEVVDRVTPAISIAVKSVISFFAGLDGAFAMLSATLVALWNGLGNLGKALERLMVGDFKGMRAAWDAAKKDAATWGDDVVETAQKTSKKIEEVWSDAKNKITGGEGKPKGIGAGGGGGTKAGESRDESEFVLIGGVLYRRSDIEKETEALYRKARAIADREEKFADLQRKRERQDTKKALDEEERDREAAFRRMTRMILEEARMKKAAAEAEHEQRLMVANAAMGLAGEVFGQTKGLAIAQAVINTYEGASKALAQGGIYGAVLAAIVIAAGMAQVAKIESTQDPTKGQGFDNPSNDAAARAGGRRWAMDMIGEFSGGAAEISRGWASGMAGRGTSSTTYNQQRTFNVHMHGAGLIDPTNVGLAKQFQRTLDVVGRTVESQRTSARAGTR